MKNWQYALVAGVLAVLIGLQLSLGTMVTGYEAVPGNQTTVENQSGSRASAAAAAQPAATIEYQNLSNKSRAEVDALITGEEMTNGTPAVVQRAGNKTPVVVTGTSNATANATANAYTITDAAVPRYPGVFRLGAISVFGGILSTYWGYRRRKIEQLEEEIAEFWSDT